MNKRYSTETIYNFWPPWSDVLLIILLMLVLYIFIQFLGYSRALIDELIGVRKHQAGMKQDIELEFAQDYKNDVRISRDGSLQKISFSDKILFGLAQADLNDQGKKVLSRVGRILTKNRFYKRIQVEGHTDDLPIKTPLYHSNWELSSARATSVVRFLQETVGIDPKLLSATGYSEYQPIVENIDVNTRSLNRRIELVLVYSTEEEKNKSVIAGDKKVSVVGAQPELDGSSSQP
jgi:outer membrane protein OmpA-like peptidoglycan-associated protein